MSTEIQSRTRIPREYVILFGYPQSAPTNIVKQYKWLNCRLFPLSKKNILLLILYI